MELKGYTKGGYFHIDCMKCEERAIVTPGRWEGLVELLME